jgi:hypothetical protein
LGADVSYLLRMMRRENRRLRRSRATVTRGTHPTVTTVHASLPVRVRPSQRATTEVESGGETVALHLYDVETDPTADLRRHDVLTILSSEDPKMVGRWLTVIEVTGDDWQAGRRVVCQESR